MTLAELQARKKALDAQIEVEKAETGEVTKQTALAWWDVATTIRDMSEPVHHSSLCYPRIH